MRNPGEQNKITISDVADALGISKTTVSRAISGKGRIGEATRKKVLDYIEAYDYKPSPIAKGLAQSKTYNIGWVMPGDLLVTDLPFFQNCLIGIEEVARAEDYDVLLSTVFDNDISQLKRIVGNRKVDGVILGRTLVKDERITYLKESNMPFVVVGSSSEKGVIGVDNNHIAACKELTSILLMKGLKKIALIGGDSNHVVNQTRKKGFEAAFQEQGIKLNSKNMYMDNEKDEEIKCAIDDALRNGAECIICMDDRIAIILLDELQRKSVKIPDDIKVASFYNSPILEKNQPPITTLKYDPKELGAVTCRTLLDYLDGKDINEKVMLGYQVILNGSTQ